MTTFHAKIDAQDSEAQTKEIAATTNGRGDYIALALFFGLLALMLLGALALPHTGEASLTAQEIIGGD